MIYYKINFTKGGLNIKNFESTQNWLPYDKIFNNGIILYKNYYLKLIKVIPINYDLKSNLEKEAILNSYKIFLKTCNFDSQILIQSKKENLSKHFSKLKEIENTYIDKNVEQIYKNYYSYILELNKNNKSSSKNFYIIIKYKLESFKLEDCNRDKEATVNLNDMYFKIKECLSRCGNSIFDVNTKEEVEEIFYSFYNLRLNL